MATVSIVLAQRAQESVPVLRTEVYASESKTSGAGSSQSTAVAPSNDYYWVVTSSGGAIWVRFGANPTAAAGDDWLIPDGGTREWEAVAGDKCAIVDA